MSQQELEIRITTDGQVEVHVIGAQGTECLEVSEFLEKALGDVKERKFKSEYYEAEVKQRQDNTVKYQQY